MSDKRVRWKWYSVLAYVYIAIFTLIKLKIIAMEPSAEAVFGIAGYLLLVASAVVEFSLRKSELSRSERMKVLFGIGFFLVLSGTVYLFLRT